jgi:hypothetical protein
LEVILQSQKKIIISRLLDSDHAMIAFLFEPMASANLREHPDVLASDSWELKNEQRILVRVALDIWNGSGNVFLWELLNGLSHQNLSRLIFALISYRDLESLSQKSRPHPREP